MHIPQRPPGGAGRVEQPLPGAGLARGRLRAREAASLLAAGAMYSPGGLQDPGAPTEGAPRPRAAPKDGESCGADRGSSPGVQA